jgi:hypothetical protein
MGEGFKKSYELCCWDSVSFHDMHIFQEVWQGHSKTDRKEYIDKRPTFLFLTTIKKWAKNQKFNPK